MTKRIFAIILIVCLALAPVAVLAATVNDNDAGTTVGSIGSGDEMNNNKGTVTTNNGTIKNHYGEVTTNNGTIRFTYIDSTVVTK